MSVKREVPAAVNDCRQNKINEVMLRRLQYRLQRQGMLELDVWLSPLSLALHQRDERVVQAVERLMMCEVPELLAMQAGKEAVPEELKPWLNSYC